MTIYRSEFPSRRSSWPLAMMIIDHVAMAVSHRGMAVGVAMWISSFPAFMFMLVMFVVRISVL